MGPSHDLHQHPVILRREWKDVTKKTGKNRDLVSLLNKSVQANHSSCIGTVRNNS
jgi:hypothetical protein